MVAVWGWLDGAESRQLMSCPEAVSWNMGYGVVYSKVRVARRAMQLLTAVVVNQAREENSSV